MSSISSTLYETVCFLGRPKPAADTPIYREMVFPTVSLYTALLALGLMLVYYYLLNRIFFVSGLDKFPGWLTFLLLTAAGGGGVAWYVTKQQGVTPHPYQHYFVLANVVLSALLYIGFSFAGRGGSTHAKPQPRLG